MAWEDLSFREKAEYIKTGVKNGLTSPEEIKNAYDSWVNNIQEHKGLDVQIDDTYDYKGYYNKYTNEAWDMLNKDSDAHFTDEFKTYLHPTFSTESKYSGIKDTQFNPNGLMGGSWGGNKNTGWTFTMPKESAVSLEDRINYLSDAENDGVRLLNYNGLSPKIDNDYFGGVLPNITIKPK